MFKRLIYEQKDELQTPLIITNEKFREYLDYELFDQLTNNDTDGLFINNLSAGYQISVTSFDEEDFDEESDEQVNENNGNQTTARQTGNNSEDTPEETEESENSTVILTDRIHDCRSYYADRRDFEKIEKSEKSDSLKGDSATGDAAEKDDKSDRINEKIEDNTKKDKKDALRVFELNIAVYWLNWQQAAHLAGFDFELLETIDNAQTIRFYEVTKLLRLSSYDETTQTLPAELEIDYEQLTNLMPLPRFHTGDEIKKQVQDLIQPLFDAGYVGKFSYAEESNKEKQNNILNFKFKD